MPARIATYATPRPRPKPVRAVGAGVSLLEVLLALAIVALLAVQAVPAAQGLLAKQRLKGAAEIIGAELRAARLEAIRANRSLAVRFVIQDSGQWCMGISDAGPCACDREECLIDGRPAPRLDSTALPHIRLASNFPGHLLRFGPLRGGARPGTLRVRIAGKSEKEMRIVVSSLGRIRLCAVRLRGYPPC